MSGIARGPIPRTEAWLERLRATLDAETGRRADFARYLCAEDPTQLPSRKVQLARVLNQGSLPEPEFVLASLEWLDALPPARRTAKAAAKVATQRAPTKSRRKPARRQ